MYPPLLSQRPAFCQFCQLSIDFIVVCLVLNLNYSVTEDFEKLARPEFFIGIIGTVSVRVEHKRDTSISLPDVGGGSVVRDAHVLVEVLVDFLNLEH